jgi:hypothetical protein
MNKHFKLIGEESKPYIYFKKSITPNNAQLANIWAIIGILPPFLRLFNNF